MMSVESRLRMSSWSVSPARGFGCVSRGGAFQTGRCMQLDSRRVYPTQPVTLASDCGQRYRLRGMLFCVDYKLQLDFERNALTTRKATDREKDETLFTSLTVSPAWAACTHTLA